MQIPNLDYKKLSKIFGGLLVFGIIYGFVLFPFIIKKVIILQVRLKPGAKTREEMYLKIPFAFDFSIYLMNITNPEEVQAGGTPIIQEVGPYKFDEYKERFDTEDDDAQDTLEFSLKSKFIFRPDKTLPLTGQERVTIPHMVVMSAMIATKRDQAPLLPMAIIGINQIFEEPSTPFLTASAWDIMFGGIPFNCEQEAFQAQAVCSVLQENLGETAVVNDTHLAFSLFKGQNDTNAGRFKVYRGLKNILNVGKLIEYNGETEIDVYDGDECNQIKGTDGLYFPPFLHKDQHVWSFASALCRSIAAWYHQKASHRGVALTRFGTTFMSKPECFCRDSDEDLCPPEGTIELSMCYQAPFIGSKPHFYDADPVLLSGVKGLKPDKKKHDIEADFELFAGAPLRAVQRLQLNMDMEAVEEFPPMKDLPKLILPVFWVEEGVNLPTEFVYLFKALHIAKHLTTFIKWTSLVVGLIGTPVSIFLMMNSPTEAVETNASREINNTVELSSKTNNSKTNKVQKEHEQKVIMKALGKDQTNEENNDSHSIDYYHTSLH